MVQWLSRTFEFAGTEGRFRSLEGARGFAMILIFLKHLHERLGPVLPPHTTTRAVADVMVSTGNIGTEFFFVITGCFIYKSLIRKPVSYFSFLRRRLIRIYPLYLCVLGVYLLLFLAFPSQSKLPHQSVPAAIYILQNAALLPLALDITPIITASWFLSFIFLFYIVMPPLIEITGMRQWARYQRVVFFTILAALYLAVSVITDAYPARTTMLFVGVLVWEAVSWREGKGELPLWSKRGAIIVVLAGLALRYMMTIQGHRLWFVPGFASYSPAYQTVVAGSCLFCFCLGAFGGIRGLGTLLSWTPLRWLGNMSYSYFLAQGLGLRIFRMAVLPSLVTQLQSPAVFWGIQPLCFVLTLPLATLLFVLVERPISVALRRKPSRTDAAPAVPPAVPPKSFSVGAS